MPAIGNALLLFGGLALITGVNFLVDPFALHQRLDLAIEKGCLF